MGGDPSIVGRREIARIGGRLWPGEKLEPREKPPAFRRAECPVTEVDAWPGGAKKRPVYLGLELMEDAHRPAVFWKDDFYRGDPAVGVMNERGELTIVVFRNLDVPRREGCSFG